MTGGIANRPKAFAIDFSSVTVWAVSAQVQVDWGWPESCLRPLADVLDRRSETLDVEADDLVQLLTIRFDGSSGASGRKRIQPTQLEGVRVPIPPLPVQQAIVRHWQEARKRIDQAADKLSAIKTTLHEEMVSRTQNYHQVCRSRVQNTKSGV